MENQQIFYNNFITAFGMYSSEHCLQILDQYYNLILNADTENIVKIDRGSEDFVYYENHHIIPKSFGGNDEEDNLILLHADEHLLAHILIYNYCKNNFYTDSQYCVKSIAAVYRLMNSCHSIDYDIDNALAQYKTTKEQIMQERSQLYSGKGNPASGRKWMYSEKEDQFIYAKPEEVENYIKLGYIYKSITSGKKMSDEARHNVSLYHADVRGSNNPMYHKNIKDYMSEDAYNEWHKKVSSNKNEEKNPVFGKVIISNEDLGQQKYIEKDDLDKFLSISGWKLGQLNSQKAKISTVQYQMKSLASRNPTGDFSQFNYEEYIKLGQGHPRRNYVLKYVSEHPKQIQENI